MGVTSKVPVRSSLSMMCALAVLRASGGVISGRTTLMAGAEAYNCRPEIVRQRQELLWRLLHVLGFADFAEFGVAQQAK